MGPELASPGHQHTFTSPALLARNSLILIAIEVLAKVLGLLVFVSLARTVGAADLGVYAFAMSLSGLAALLPRFGFERYVQRELPRTPEAFPRLWATIVAVKVPLSLIAGGGVLVALWLGRSPAPKTWVVLLILTSVLLHEFVLFHAACFRAFQRPEFEAQVRLAFSGLYAALGLLALRVGLGLGGVALVLVMASALATAHSTWLLHRRIHRLAFSVEPGMARVVLRESFPLFLLFLVVLLYNQADVLLLSFLAGDREVGVYAAAGKIFEATVLIPAGVMGTVLPALAHDWGVSREQFAGTFERAFRYLTMLSLPLAVGGTLCASEMVRLLYGPQYGASASALRILIWTAVFSFWNHLLFAALIAMDRERKLLMIGVGGVGVSATTNLLLIPGYGAMGSGAAAVITQAVLFLLSLGPVLRETRNGRDLLVAVRHPAFGTGAMAAALWLIRGSPLPLLILTGIVIYCSALLASGAVRPAQLRAVFHGIWPE